MYRFQMTLWSFKGRPSPFGRRPSDAADPGNESGFAESKFSDSTSSPHQSCLDLAADSAVVQRTALRSRMATAPVSRAGVVSLNRRSGSVKAPSR
jgi:hypothetical protein